MGIAEVLKSEGIDAIYVNAIGLAGASDREVLDEAARQKRCVVTRNRNDFLELTSFCCGRSFSGEILVPIFS
jgi:predicted nuclease of predicted toxin-antitoxin system